MNKIKILSHKLMAIPTERKVGLFLLVPPLLSVIIFALDFFGSELLQNFNYGWTGQNETTLPIYFGLMAIAGGYLLKKNVGQVETDKNVQVYSIYELKYMACENKFCPVCGANTESLKKEVLTARFKTAKFYLEAEHLVPHSTLDSQMNFSIAQLSYINSYIGECLICKSLVLG